jgi:peptidoglycan/LPS O-acetylase OafA/YrhL
VSYGIYLYHHLVRHVVDKGIGHFGPISKIAFTVVLSLATWAFAEASFRFYEMRFLALKARLTK